MKKPNLKPCPKCGGEARITAAHGFYGILCPGCGHEFYFQSTARGEVVRKWNKQGTDYPAIRKARELAHSDLEILREITAVKNCGNCKLFEVTRPKMGIQSCRAPFDVSHIPASIQYVRLGMTPYDGENCPCHEAKEGT